MAHRYMQPSIANDFTPATGARIRQLLSNQSKRARRLKSEEAWTALARKDEERFRHEQVVHRQRALDSRNSQKNGLDTQLREKQAQRAHEDEERKRIAAETELSIRSYKDDTEKARQDRRVRVLAEKQRIRDQMEASVTRRKEERSREKAEALQYVQRITDELVATKLQESSKKKHDREVLLKNISDERDRHESEKRAAAELDTSFLGSSQLHAAHEEQAQKKRAQLIKDRMEHNTEYFLRNKVASWDELAARDELRAQQQQEDMARKEEMKLEVRRRKQEAEKVARLAVLRQQVEERRRRAELEKEDARRSRARLVESEKNALAYEVASKHHAKREMESRRACLDCQLELRCHRETLPLETGIGKSVGSVSGAI